jgi:O-antigen/teichoic acid export membrane protein
LLSGLARLHAQERSIEITACAGATTLGVFPVVVAAGVVSLFFITPLLAVFLDVSFATASLLVPYVVLASFAAIPLGVLQVRLRFGAFAVVVVSGVVVRLGTGIGLVDLGLGLSGAMLASSLAAANLAGRRLLADRAPAKPPRWHEAVARMDPRRTSPRPSRT